MVGIGVSISTAERSTPSWARALALCFFRPALCSALRWDACCARSRVDFHFTRRAPPFSWLACSETVFLAEEIVGVSITPPINKLVTAFLLTEGPSLKPRPATTFNSIRLAAGFLCLIWLAFSETVFLADETVGIPTTTPINKLVTAFLLTEGPARIKSSARTYNSRRLAAGFLCLIWLACSETVFLADETVGIPTTTPINKLVTAFLLTEGPARISCHA